MSGGSYDYSFHHVNEMAGRLEHSTDIVRRAFASHLQLVAKAMHDVEWVDSCDYAPGGDHEAIRAVIEPERVDAAARALVVSIAYSILRTYGLHPEATDSEDG